MKKMLMVVGACMGLATSINAFASEHIMLFGDHGHDPNEYFLSFDASQFPQMDQAEFNKFQVPDVKEGGYSIFNTFGTPDGKIVGEASIAEEGFLIPKFFSYDPKAKTFSWLKMEAPINESLTDIPVAFEMAGVKMVSYLNYHYDRQVAVYKDGVHATVADLPVPTSDYKFISAITATYNANEQQAYLYVLWYMYGGRYGLVSYTFDPASFTFKVHHVTEFQQKSGDSIIEMVVAQDGSAYMPVNNDGTQLAPQQAVRQLRQMKLEHKVDANNRADYALLVEPTGVTKNINLWDENGKTLPIQGITPCKTNFDKNNNTYVTCRTAQSGSKIYQYQGVMPSDTKPMAIYQSENDYLALGNIAVGG